MATVLSVLANQRDRHGHLDIRDGGPQAFEVVVLQSVLEHAAC